jgi:phosphoribosylglycinamide formyltransferase-1
VDSKKKFRIAIFASGSGTNAEAIMQHFRQHPSIEVVLLLSNNAQAYALERAKKFQVITKQFNKEQFRGADVRHSLVEAEVTHIVLAGFLWLVPKELVEAFPNRIINIHPALLPNFGGKGMYGEKVHAAVKAAGETKTGITIHLVNDQFDEGKILFQATCDVGLDDTPDTIAEKVHRLEHEHFPTVIERWIMG